MKHPNIVSVHEVGREDGTIYIVSDFIDGANFAMGNVQTAHAMMGQKLSRMRAQRRSNETVRNDFTDEERKKMM